MRVKRQISPVQSLRNEGTIANQSLCAGQQIFNMIIGTRQLLATALWISLVGSLGAAPPSHAPSTPSNKQSHSRADPEHMREELGVNEFTAPSIGLIFDQLKELRPIPFDKAWRDLPESIPQERPRLALCAGQTIANGFLAIETNKQSRVEASARSLVRLAKGLGVADHVNKRSKSIMEMAVRDQWDDLKKELTRAQTDVESGMMALKDEEIAHLVSLGGWIRALEMTSSVVAAKYSPERARTLVQPELFDYFIERVSTLNPNLRKAQLFQTIEANLREIQKLTTRPVDTPIELKDVQKIRDLARQMNRAIANLPDEPENA